MDMRGAAHARYHAPMRLAPLLLALALLAACDRPPPAHPRAIQLPDEPFLIGAPDRYRAPGVYGPFSGRGVFLSSNGEMLVALSAACPHDGCGVVYQSMANQFKCPCCARRYTAMGLARGSPPDEPLAMRRLHLEPAAGRAPRPGPADNLRVFPQRPYVQEKNEWSYRYSLYMFE